MKLKVVINCVNFSILKKWTHASRAIVTYLRDLLKTIGNKMVIYLFQLIIVLPFNL